MIYGALPKPPRFLELSEVLTLHESAIDQFGGSYGIRDTGLLDAALNMPKQAFSGNFAHSIPFGMAAAYAFHICKNHPFVDGNKRTALAAMVVFLHMNGWELAVPDLDAATKILGLAEGSSSKEALEAWIAANGRARPSLELRDFFAGLTPEIDFSFVDTSAAGGEKELMASCEEAGRAIPVIAHLVQRSEELRGQGNEIAAVALVTRALTLVAIYRLAEDMGYEW